MHEKEVSFELVVKQAEMTTFHSDSGVSSLYGMMRFF